MLATQKSLPLAVPELITEILRQDFEDNVFDIIVFRLQSANVCLGSDVSVSVCWLVVLP